MAKKSSGLGKGFSAMMNDNKVIENVSSGSTLPISEIIPNRNQPRQTFDENSLNQLAADIEKHGVLQPILVRPLSSGGYQIVAGERRFRASKIAGLKEMPVIIKNLSDEEAMELAIIENLQRENLNPIEEAEGFLSLMQTCNLSQDEVAQKLSKSRAVIANAVRLLNLPDELREYVKIGKLTRAQGRTLLSFEDKEEMKSVAEMVITKNLSVREIEQMARNAKIKRNSKPAQVATSTYLQEVRLALSEALGTKVKIYGNSNKGKLEIEFYSEDELKDIANKLASNN